MTAAVLWLSGGNNLLAGGLVMLVIIVLGFPLETMSLMIIFVPILAPLGPKLGFGVSELRCGSTARARRRGSRRRRRGRCWRSAPRG